MAFPTRGQVYGLFLQILDDPGGSVFTDTPNAITGAPSIFQSGFSQALDILYNTALNQQVPKAELVVDGIIVPPSPVQFSLTPAQMGLQNFADFEWVSERAAGSNDKFLDLWDEDRLTQREPVDRLLEFVYQNGAFQFVGCTTTRELQIKYVDSIAATTDNDAVITFDSSLNFLANYAASACPSKGYEAEAAKARSFAVGPKFDMGMIGGELFRLMQPLVRSRQGVVVAHKPYRANRWQGRRGGFWGPVYVAAQQGTTGGGAQNTPIGFSSANLNPSQTIIGAIDGANLVFWVPVPVLRMTVYRNGLIQTPGMDMATLNNQITFFPASVPQVGDTISAEVYQAFPQ